VPLPQPKYPSVPYIVVMAKIKVKLIIWFLKIENNSKFNNLHIVGSNTTKPSPSTPPC